MKLGWVTVVLLTGMMLPVQAAVNAKLRTFVVNPIYSALISFGVGTSLLIVLASVMAWAGWAGHLRGAVSAPWWTWVGGALGAVFVTMAILAVPRIGAAGYSVAIITGQFIGALILDHYGWLGLPEHPLTWSRLLGAVLLLVAVWLIQR
ncbi:DMT family transporter [Chloracidobacterium aggregatum]|jgi:transporter family-2 protein|uniref:DMT family transporter n=1 Tax=Chloracidobacterium sp. N TaxID=2821540 RepID=A0ABX8B4S0_9BACT|nr:DMT family transporter [Chloracidobacterium aggregatum]QUV85199.1 DMT family transporter [Chloracidobacterium sp. 2]QUV88402.1 DMT family transporter [Chloracidobacterium sp. S]QUV91318.1 DMT family transporter [Chloracidobacterium sp. A]QUV94499.1 DMT family transporter [Chloracidobacterium sp. N]QUV97701.1 DMT family transporter [Chloracidobacterium sp. E]